MSGQERVDGPRLSHVDSALKSKALIPFEASQRFEGQGFKTQRVPR